jgi:hypothetical protein
MVLGKGARKHPTFTTIQQMRQDKQLHGVELDVVLQKRRLGQALNAKEFAVLSGISYSTAREWFRLPGFPALRGFVFWDDFVEWRRSQAGLGEPKANGSGGSHPLQGTSTRKGEIKLPARAAQILIEAG